MLLGIVWRIWFFHAVFVDHVSVRFPIDAAEAKNVNMPFTLKSPKISTDFRVEAVIEHFPTQSGVVRFAPDDCFLQVTLNGRDITQLFDKETCWPQIQIIDLSDHLQNGDNRLNVVLHDKDIDHGLKIFGVPPYDEILMMALGLALSFYLLPQIGLQNSASALRLLDSARRLADGTLRRIFPPAARIYWLVSLLPMVGFALMSFSEWPRFGFGLSMLRVELLPMHIAFLLWIRHCKIFELHPPAPSRLMWAMALTGFIMGSLLFGKQMQSLRLFFIWGGMISSFFIFIRWQYMWELAQQHRRFSMVAVACGLTACGFYLLQEVIWRQMVYTTGIFIRTFLMAIGVDADIIGSSAEPVYIRTSAFNINIHQPCSGLEGIFLFLFLLSVLLMLDWKVFGRFRIWPLYVFGYLYMYVMNAIRIGALFLIGHWSWQDNAGEQLKSLRGAPFELFHSYTGWVIYLLAFMLFAVWMYRRARKLLIDDACGRAYE